MTSIRIGDRVLVEGQDYHLHFVRFPNRANPAQLWTNDDDTYDIYLNTLYWSEDDKLKDAFRHEIEHILRRHFEDVGVGMDQIEAEADGASWVNQLTVHDFLHPPRGMIPCFGSEAAMARWINDVVMRTGIRL